MALSFKGRTPTAPFEVKAGSPSSALAQHPSKTGYGCYGCYGQPIFFKAVRTAKAVLVVLVPKCARRPRSLRALPKEAATAATWHRGCSSSSDVGEAISEVVAEWRQSFGRSQVSQDRAGDFQCATDTWAPFTRIDELWHNWRAGSYGPVTLAQVVKSSADQKDLREAFKLFPDQGATSCCNIQCFVS